MKASQQDDDDDDLFDDFEQPSSNPKVAKVEDEKPEPLQNWGFGNFEQPKASPQTPPSGEPKSSSLQDSPLNKEIHGSGDEQIEVGGAEELKEDSSETREDKHGEEDF